MLDAMATKKRVPIEDFPPVVRLSDELRERCARLAHEMSKRIAGAEVPPTAVVRSALLRGLDALEDDLGIKRSK